MGMSTKRTIGKIVYHVLVCGLGLVMIYPLVWMIMSSFKPTQTLFTTANQLFPSKCVLEMAGRDLQRFHLAFSLKILCLFPSLQPWVL